jgi:MFS family permease
VPPEAERPYPPPVYAWYVVGVLTLFYVLSFIDRQILALLVEPMRRDLAISDTQISLLMGTSFALFYTFFGILLGRLADTSSRRGLIAAGITLWSLFTAACGAASGFAQMLLMRMGVGVGEASLSPAAYSLICDYFPERRRSTALGVYSTGIYLGAGLAFILGGAVVGAASVTGTAGGISLPILGTLPPWRAIFLIVGAPGLLMAALAATVREPARRGTRPTIAAGGSRRVERVPVREVALYLRRNGAAVVCHNGGVALTALAGYAVTAWTPTFLIRVHGWSASRAGLVFGAVVMIAGAAGVVAGGRLADGLASRGRRDADLRVALLTSVAWLPFGLLFPLVPTAAGAIALLVPTIFFSSAVWGVAPAAIQRMMPNAMRAQASALFLFVVNLIGLGLGPTAVALATDRLFHDDRAVGRSLAIVGAVAYAGAIALLAAGLRPYRRSLDRLDAWMEAGAITAGPPPSHPSRPEPVLLARDRRARG